MINLGDILPTAFLQDFLTFCQYTEAAQPKLSASLHSLPPTFLFEVNEKMSKPAQNVKPKSPQAKYNTLHFFQTIAFKGQLFEKDVTKSKTTFLPVPERLAKFRNMTPSDQYLFLLKVFWCHLSFEEMGEDFGVYPNTELLGVFINMFCDLRKPLLTTADIPELSFGVSQLKPIFKFMEQMGFWVLTFEMGKPEEERYWHFKQLDFTPLGMGLLHILDSTGPLFVWNNVANIGTNDFADEEMLNMINEMDAKGQKAFLETMFSMGEEIGLDTESVQDVSIDQLKAQISHSIETRKAGFEALFSAIIPCSETLEVVAYGNVKGNYHFKVAFAHEKNIWRHIVLASHHTFEDFHLAIQRAVGFDNDHLYAFYPDGNVYSKNTPIQSPHEDATSPLTTEVPISALTYEPNHRMVYLFDFGDNWQFEVILEHIDTESPLVLAPQIAESQGEAPEQYPALAE